MDLKTHKTQTQPPSRQATLCYLVRDNQILLAMKKRGFGHGKWNGIGGKPDIDETIFAAAIREMQEEIMITPTDLQQRAVFDFYFVDKPEWNQQVVVYLVNAWHGEPQETEEMRPQWFDQSKIPFDSMWPADKHFIPRILAGENLYGEFLCSSDDGLYDFNIEFFGEK